MKRQLFHACMQAFGCAYVPTSGAWSRYVLSLYFSCHGGFSQCIGATIYVQYELLCTGDVAYAMSISMARRLLTHSHYVLGIYAICMPICKSQA